MTATGHAVIGAAIVTKIPDLRLALPLALASHFFFDAFPHWDTGTNWREKGLRKVFFDTLIDLGLGYALVFLVFILYLHADFKTLILGVTISQLPDFLEVPYFFLHWEFFPWHRIYHFIHFFHKKIPVFNFTFAWQVVLSGAFILWAII